MLFKNRVFFTTAGVILLLSLVFAFQNGIFSPPMDSPQLYPGVYPPPDVRLPTVPQPYLGPYPTDSPYPTFTPLQIHTSLH